MKTTRALFNILTLATLALGLPLSVAQASPQAYEVACQFANLPELIFVRGCQGELSSYNWQIKTEEAAQQLEAIGCPVSDNQDAQKNPDMKWLTGPFKTIVRMSDECSVKMPGKIGLAANIVTDGFSSDVLDVKATLRTSQKVFHGRCQLLDTQCGGVASGGNR